MPVTLSDNLAEALIAFLIAGTIPALAAVGFVKSNNDMLSDIQQRLKDMSATNTTVNAQVDAELQGIQRDMQQQTSVTQSVLTLVGGLASQLQTALAAATDKGASAEQLQGIKDFHAGLIANTAALAAMVTANTVAATEPVPEAPPVGVQPSVEVPPVGGTDAGVQGDTEGSAQINE